MLGEVSDLNGDQTRPKEIVFTWSPPYSLDGVPILGYESDIAIITISDGSVVHAYHEAVNDTKLVVLKPESEQSCLYINVSVLPLNEVGNGTAINDIFHFSESEYTCMPVHILCTHYT